MLSCGFAGDDPSPSTDSLACSSTYCSRLKSRRPCHSCSVGVASIADHRENTVQVVPACAQDVRRARSRLHCQPVDARLWHSFTVIAASNCDLVVPRRSRKTGDRAFSFATSRAWNWLPTHLKRLHLTASFKNKLKSFLFHAAYTGSTVTVLCELWNEPSVWTSGGALQVTVITVTITNTTVE